MLTTELKADHEKEEEKKLEKMLPSQEKNTWAGLSPAQQEQLMMRRVARGQPPMSNDHRPFITQS